MERFRFTRRYKEGLFKTGQALADIDKAIEMRDTPIARAFRAMVAGDIANVENDLPAAERALADLRLAKRRLPDNKFVRFKSLHGHMYMANLYDETGQSEKRKAALEEAGRDAEELKGILNYSYVISRVFYFDLIQNADAALAELKWASSQPETSDLVGQYALALYERGEDAKALGVLDDRLKPDNSAVQMLRIILWAEQSEIGRDEAFDRYQKLVAGRNQPKWDGPMWTPSEASALILLGKRKEALSQAEQVSGGIPIAEKYLRGDMTEAEFLQSNEKNRMTSCFAHHLVGLVRLSNGDRAGAGEHFQKALDTKIYANIQYPYARAYLARLKRDPEWPRWIPVKKN
jgi:tetratricopeptide (TPR) repeat protein